VERNHSFKTRKLCVTKRRYIAIIPPHRDLSTGSYRPNIPTGAHSWQLCL